MDNLTARYKRVVKFYYVKDHTQKKLMTIERDIFGPSVLEKA
jgi:hypothetical protein